MPSITIPERLSETSPCESRSVEEQYHDLYKSLVRHPHLLQSVRTVRFGSLDKYVHNEGFCPLLDRFWLAARNIETLDLSFGGVDWELMNSSVKTALENLLLFPQLKSLTIRNVKNLSPKVMALCIKNTPFVELQSVSFLWLSEDSEDEVRSPSAPSLDDSDVESATRTLKIANVPFESAIVLSEALVAQNYKLDTLIAGPLDRLYSEADVHTLQVLANSNEHTITTLDFREVTSSRLFDLSMLTQLQTLKLRLGEKTGKWQDIRKTIETVSVETNLTQLVIQIKFHRFMKLGVGAKLLDEELATTPKLLDLESVLLLMDWANRGEAYEKKFDCHDKVTEEVKKVFPLMAEKNKVSWSDNTFQDELWSLN